MDATASIRISTPAVGPRAPSAEGLLPWATETSSVNMMQYTSRTSRGQWDPSVENNPSLSLRSLRFPI